MPNWNEGCDCSYCKKNKALDELAKETQEIEKFLTPEQEEWLDKNKDLMDDLVKSGD